jgi:hypothetical protein
MDFSNIFLNFDVWRNSGNLLEMLLLLISHVRKKDKFLISPYKEFEFLMNPQIFKIPYQPSFLVLFPYSPTFIQFDTYSVK